MSLFAYHSGYQALLIPMPDGRQGHMAVPTKTLRAHGWLAADDDLRRALPRADAPAIAPPTAAQVAALQKRH